MPSVFVSTRRLLFESPCELLRAGLADIFHVLRNKVTAKPRVPPVLREGHLMQKISVVTAVFNRDQTIGEAIESVTRQTYPNVEHVIQDGGSTDGTLAEIESVIGPNTLLETASDGGIYDGINKGILRATGDIIGLMHSDDLFASDDILSRVAEAMSDPEVDGVYGDLDYVAADDVSQVIRRWRSGVYDAGKLRRGWMPPHPTLYLRREVFDRLGGYDTSYHIAADYDAMLRYLSKGAIRLSYIPEVFVKMRVGGESNRSISKVIKKSREDYRAIRSNNVGGVGTLIMKNVSKIQQFF